MKTTRTTCWVWLAAVTFSFNLTRSSAFLMLPTTNVPRRLASSCRQRRRDGGGVTVVLEMGKGLNKARNKQAELARKLELAKKQNDDGSSPQTDKLKSDKTIEKLSEAEIKKRNDRLRFESLLKAESANVLNAYAGDGYLSQEQEEEEISAARSGVERLFEGDPAPTAPFEELVSIVSENAIGTTGASRLVPWLRKNAASRASEYLIILTDPRMKCPELRQTVKNLSLELPPDLLDKMIVVNADSPAENRRWIKKSGLEKVDVYSDEKMEWMRAYTALGDKRWAMCMFIIANERVQKLAREVDGLAAGRVIQNAVKSLDLA